MKRWVTLFSNPPQLAPAMYHLMLIFILTGTYLYTVLQGIGYSGDTVKFQYTGYLLGTPHPPGYPLYLMLNHIFIKLFPFGSMAYRANVLSSLCAVGSCLVLFNILIRLFTIRSLIAFVISLTFGFTLTLWSQAVVAEVYSLNILFFGAVLYFFISWQLERKISRFYTACALYALSFGNHLIMITILGGIVYLVLVTDKKLFITPKTVVIVALFIAIGISQYSYFLWRYYAGSTYLEIVTPDMKSLWSHMTCADFMPEMFSAPLSKVFYLHIPLILLYIVREYNFLIPLVLFGMFQLKKNPKLHIFLIFCILGNLFFTVNYNIRDVFVYPMITYYILAVYLACGINRLGNFPYISQYKKICSVSLFAIPVIFFAMNLSVASQRNNIEDEKTTQSVLRTIDKNAVIISVSYFSSQCLFYYLAGQNAGPARNLYLIDQRIYPRKLYNYLYNNTPMTDDKNPVKVHAPPGLPVYLIGHYRSDKSQIIQSGLSMADSYYKFLKYVNRIAQKMKMGFLPEDMVTMRVITDDPLFYNIQIAFDSLPDVDFRFIKITDYLYRIEKK